MKATSSAFSVPSLGPTFSVADEPTRATDHDVGVELAEAMARARYEDLPDEVVASTKRSLLDTIGVIMAASQLGTDIPRLVEVVTESGGKEEATILGYGTRVPAMMAAFANGAMAHCLDYDDVFQEYAIHPSTTTVPTALALAERQGGVSGRDLITALAVAADFDNRLAKSYDWKYDWYSSAVFGYFASAAVASRILRLDASQMFNALGIAFCQAAGTLEMRIAPGSNLSEMINAWPNKAGTLAALLAKRGVGGVPFVFEGERGLYNIFFGGQYRRRKLVEGLGRQFSGHEVSFRAYPVCGSGQPSIDAALHVLRTHQLDFRSIEAVEIRIGHPVDWSLCEPLAARRKPPTSIDARFSIPFQIATALVRGRVTLADISADAIADPQVLEVASKVTPILDPALQQYCEGVAGAVQISVRMRDGKVFTHRLDHFYGRYPENIMSTADLEAKFRDCVSVAARPPAESRVERAVELVRSLETCSDVRELVDCLSGR